MKKREEEFKNFKQQCLTKEVEVKVLQMSQP
jgi:hypothetical protein